MLIIGYGRAAPAPAPGPAPGGSVPTLGSSTTATILAGSGGTTPVSLTGLGLVEGDLVLVGVAGDGNFVAEGGGIATGQGYTDIVAKQFLNNVGVHVACKVMGATPDASVVIDRNSGRGQAVVVQVVKGVNRITPVDGPAQAASGAVGTGMPNAPGYATGTANCLRVTFGGIDDVLVTPTGAPSGWTGLVHVGSNSAGGTGTAMFAFKGAPAAGSEDPAAFGGTNTAEPWVAFHFALRGI